MIWAIYFMYLVSVGFIRVYKWLELQVIKLLLPLFRRKAYQLTESCGIVLHLPGDKEWTEADSERVLQKCKYNSLVHVTVKDMDLMPRIVNTGTLGVGEGYMDGLLQIGSSYEDISEAATRWFENDMMLHYWNPWNKFLEWLELHAFNLQTKARAFQVVKEHYHLGDDLFEAMLDPWMQYTCGYWAKATNLSEAQIDKMELIAKKLDLQPGMRVLDIGCGWGGLCKFLSEEYGVECVGVTIAQAAVTFGKHLTKDLKVDIRLCDYRDLDEEQAYDRIVSVGMFEHVGIRNYGEFFKVVRKCLKDDGIFLLHTLANNHTTYQGTDMWSHRYIFPNGYAPMPKDICINTEGLFVIEDWHNFGQDYAKTLYAWRENFVAAWPKLKSQYDDRFFKMWVLYLSSARALFRSRRLQLWQIVLSKDGLKRDYRRPLM